MKALEEIWVPVKGFERYLISTHGRVWDTKRDVEVPQFINDRGYKIVHLRREKTDKKARVHRLVAEAFIPNPYNLPQVNHKDENKLNNRVDNLEWCDNTYNMNYGSIPLRAVPVVQYTMDGVFVREWRSARLVAESLGKDPRTIRRCCNGCTKSAYGFKWRWKK